MMTMVRTMGKTCYHRQIMNLQELRDNYREDILRIAAKYGLTNVRVFGSVARGEATENSDVDLLVTATKPLTLFDTSSFQLDVEDLVHKKVQIKTDDYLNPLIKESILEGARLL